MFFKDMTVKDLIDELSKLPQDSTIGSIDNDIGCGYASKCICIHTDKEAKDYLVNESTSDYYIGYFL